MVLGSIYRQVRSYISLGPDNPGKYYKPIREVLDQVLKLDINRYPGHADCGRSLACEMRALKDDLKRIWDCKEYEDHFAKQAAKCGWTA